MNQLAVMTANPALGIVIFVLGGLAGAVFYLPLKNVKKWAWESYWLFWALFALLIVPFALAMIQSPNTLSVLKAAPSKELLYCYLCGAAWGFGGLTWGLMIRYLGVGLGLAMGCGLCSAAGTIVPKILTGSFGSLFDTDAGKVSFVGVLVSLFGIVLVGLAGMSKEKELPEAEKKKAVAEYNFGKGMLVALFSGLMSAALSFGLQGGPSIELKAEFGSETAIVQGTPDKKPSEIAGANAFYDAGAKSWVAPSLAPSEQATTAIWKGMPVLVIALLGGFTVNFLWCLFLNAKNKTFGDYTKKDAPILPNIIFGAIAGAIWVCQFVAFKTGEPQMGGQSYVGWAVLMASSIMFSGILGLILGEWKGTSGKTRGLLGFGLAVLLGSAVLSGYSGKLGQDESNKIIGRDAPVTAPATNP
jgi:L-rhamnose-H+ transport protein